MKLFCLLLFLSTLLCCSSCGKISEDLLQNLPSESLEKLVTTSAAVFQDPSTKALTLTFRYTQGEPEVRIPVAAMGWPTDWSQYASIQYTFSTTSQETIAIGFSDGTETKFFITEPLPGIRIFGVIPFDTFVQTRHMTPLRPLGYKVWPQRLFTFEKVQEIVFQMRYPSQDSQFTLFNFTLRKDIPADDILDKKPLIDRYGQWIPENWEDKATSDVQLKELWEQDQLAAEQYPFCLLGGDASRQFEATGFFRTEQTDGIWVLVDPHGHPFYSAGIDLVDHSRGSFATDVTNREFLFEELPQEGPAWLSPAKDVSFYVANVIKRHGDRWDHDWNKHIVDRLRNWGFNTIGNWSSRDLAVESGMPYVLPLQGWTTKKTFPFPYDFPDIFSDEFGQNVDAAAEEQVTELKDDPRLIGWFLGNEPRWARDFGALQSWPDMLLSDPDDSATKRHLQKLLADNPGREQVIKDDFLYVCAERYFNTITDAVRRHDPNHLVLGIRFAGRPDDRWAELSRVFDVFSMNIYSSTFKPDPEMVRHFSELSGKPVMIGEFTAGTPGRGLQGLFYYVHKVKDHAERGKAYRYYVESCAASPYIIGAHWFQLVDDLPTGRPSDEERMNYGFINVIDLPYPDLVEAAKIAHKRLYDLTFGRTQPFSEKPEYN
jgi:hypothetical protein